MAVTWAESAEKRGIPRDEVLYAIAHAHAMYEDFGEPRPPHQRSPRLYIGPSRYGTLEILVEITPPAEVLIFHVMPLRVSTSQAVGYQEER
ncbi:hypothetical protein [Cellulomonas sp. NPDC089187]|uniref:hypothetical protein n=1 Tax=Cellulomonas sp. NPDC089187 TaxID=3154970 RepID=UPI0034277ECC